MGDVNGDDEGPPYDGSGIVLQPRAARARGGWSKTLNTATSCHSPRERSLSR
jgi:hypothetical protein